VKARARPRFGKGVKLRRDRDDGVMLLVPEGALVLNRTAAAALELVDGKRTLSQIVDAVAERFEVSPERARDDINELFDRLTQRGFVRCLP
jgi:pyrroloquinoline quinone biosynthesis protein D